MCGGIEGFIDTVSAFHPSELTCALQGAVSGALDFFSLSILPGANQDNWSWSTQKLGFIYIGGAESGSVSAGDAAGKAGDYVAENEWAQNYIRRYLRKQGLKISDRRIARYSGRLGKYAGWNELGLGE